MKETPHDALAKFVFKNPERAAAELSIVLPEALSKRFDWSTLRLHDGSFIDPELVETYSDLLFQVDLAKYPTLVYVLFEHKSSPQRLTPFQLLCYVVRVLESHVRQCRVQKIPALPLPPVIPMVLHHSESGWTAPTELLPLFGPVLQAVPELEACLPSLHFIVDDISHLSDEQLRQRALDAVTKLALWAMRDGRAPARLLESFGHWADLLNELEDAADGGEALDVIFRYISKVANGLDVDQLRQAARQLAPRIESRIMTIAEQMRREGRAEGRAEGRLEGGAAILQGLLEEKFGPLPEHLNDRLRAATEEQLTCWAKRVLIADSFEAVFGE